jgi:hypothetical protein
MEVKKKNIRKNIKNDHQNIAMVKGARIVMAKSQLKIGMMYFFSHYIIKFNTFIEKSQSQIMVIINNHPLL